MTSDLLIWLQLHQIQWPALQSSPPLASTDFYKIPTCQTCPSGAACFFLFCLPSPARAAEPQHRRTARLLLVAHHSQEQPNCEYSDATTLIQTALCSTQAHLSNSQPDNDPYKIRFSEEPQLLLPLGVSPNPWPPTQLLHPSSHPSGSFHINLTLLVSSHQLPQLLQSAKCIYVSGIFCLFFFPSEFLRLFSSGEINHNLAFSSGHCGASGNSVTRAWHSSRTRGLLEKHSLN